MPVGVKLIDLRRELRAETGQTLNPAQGVAAQQTQDIQLDRQQRELWQGYEWPHLRYWEDIAASAGQSIYNYPTSMPFDQVNRIYYAEPNSTLWRDLQYGLRAYDFSLSTPQRGTPCRWGNKVAVVAGKTNPNGQVQLLPVPGQSGTLRFEGQAPVNPLVNDDDVCVIDSKAIVLFAAVEILATNKAEAAQLKLQKAQRYMQNLMRQQGADKRRAYNMAGAGHLAPSYARAGIDYIPSSR